MQNSGNGRTSAIAAVVAFGVLILMVRVVTPNQAGSPAEELPATSDIVAEETPAAPAPPTPADSSGTARTVAATPPPPLAVIKPVAKAKPAATTAPAPPVTTVKAQTAAAEPKTPASPGPAIAEAVNQWAACWAAQNVSCYLAAYSTGFVPENGGSLETWKQIRTKKVSAPKSIAVTLSPLQLVENKNGQATVQFEQEYRSPTYADKALKTLVLKKDAGSWKIVRETSVALQ